MLRRSCVLALVLKALVELMQLIELEQMQRGYAKFRRAKRLLKNLTGLIGPDREQAEVTLSGQAKARKGGTVGR